MKLSPPSAIVTFLAGLICLALITTEVYPYPNSREAEKLVDSLMSRMTEEELLAQLLIVGYSTVEPSPLLLQWIRTRGIGGVKIFGWNAENLTVLQKSIQQMQEESHRQRLELPLFIATDQEGGWVRHVKGETSVTPGNLALGAARYPYDAYRTGYFIGKELKALGINMNFAPTVDVYANPEAHVIGPRAFSSDPVLTGILGVAYFRGMAETGVICAAKHYPGHGNADQDSHGAMPIIPDTFETLWNRDLLPYRMLIAEGIPAILSGHVNFPFITKDKRPSSLSSFFNIQVLRNQLGFKGLLITDDLYMTGANYNRTLAEVCVEALEAGNDLLLLSKTPELQDPIWKSLLHRYRTNPQFRQRVLESVRRVLWAKITYIEKPSLRNANNNGDSPLKLSDPEIREFFLEQAARSVTLLKNNRSVLPYDFKGEHLLLAGPFKEFLEVGKEFFPQASTFRYSYSPFYRANPEEKRALERLASSTDTLIFCLANPNGLELLKTLKGYRGKLIVFSTLTPVYLRNTPWVDTALAVFGYGADSFRAGFSAITGLIPALGKNPIETLFKEGGL
ncbi:MAG: glycoside hydrolase family 3 protein [Spirochaetales bacterium]